MTSRPNGQQPFRNGLIHQAGQKRRASDELPTFLEDFIPVLDQNVYQSHPTSLPPSWEQLWKQLLQLGIQFLRRLKLWKPQKLWGTPLVLILIWLIVLWWGEEAVFRRKVEDCAWNRWETWVCPCSSYQDELSYRRNTSTKLSS